MTFFSFSKIAVTQQWEACRLADPLFALTPFLPPL